MSAETTCRFEELDRGVLAVSLRPELNEVPWTDIERIGSGIVDRVTNRDRPRVIVDLTPLNHMGSSMVALVVRIWKACTERQGRMIVVNNSDLVGEVLQISGLAGKWTIVPARSEALDAFGSGSGPSGTGAGESKTALAFAISAAVAVVGASLTLADAALSGSVTGSLGREPTIGLAIGLAALALVLGILSTVKSYGNLKLFAVSVTTLAGVVLIGALALLVLKPRAADGDAAPADVNAAPSFDDLLAFL